MEQLEAFEKDKLNIYHHLKVNPTATFHVSIGSDAMQEAHILPDSLAIVDKSVPLEHDRIVIAYADGFLIRRYVEKEGQGWLVAENKNKDYPPIKVEREMIWGVVVGVVRRMNEATQH